jgi:hypothetical protein
MNLSPHLSLGRISKYVKILILLAAAGSLVGCRPPEATPTSITPVVEVQILTPSLLTETPIPACVFLDDVELFVSLLSEHSVNIKITGLIPNEAVQAILNSQIEEQGKEIIISGIADEKGEFTDSIGLRSQTTDAEFKDWQVRIVHSRGSTCTEFVLP